MLESVRVDRAELWRVRLYYFLFIGAAGMLSPFVSLFYERRGLSGTEIGLLSTISSAVALAAAPLWGRWSDSARHPRRLLQAALLGGAVCMLWLNAQTVFAWMAVVIALDGLAAAAIEPLSDSLALAVTRGGGERSGFGSVRLWGSLGWALLALVGGWLVERSGLSLAFGGYALLGTAAVLVLGRMNTEARPAVGPGPGLQWRTLLGSLARDRAMVGLGLALVVLWLTSAGYHQFESIYLDQLGAGESVIGLVNTLGALVELPFMWWADSLMRRHGSHRLLSTAFAIHAVSMVVVLIAPSVPAILVQRAIWAIAYSFFAVALTVFISERAPAGQSATTLALYLVTLRSLVGIVSGPIGGLAFDAFGAYWLYALALGGYVIAGLLVRFTATGRRSRREIA